LWRSFVFVCRLVHCSWSRQGTTRCSCCSTSETRCSTNEGRNWCVLCVPIKSVTSDMNFRRWTQQFWGRNTTKYSLQTL
jgi:hypothetical protein